MATIVEMINPLTGLPEQVDKLDHTAQEIDDAVGLAPQLSNPNLLDNWYFGNPVDQRGGYVVPPGVPSYSDKELTISVGDTTGYRQVIATTSTYTAYIGNDGATYYCAPKTAIRGYTGNVYCIDRWRLQGGNCNLVDDGLLITSSDQGQIFVHRFPQEMRTALSGKTVTFSVLATIRYGRFFLTDTGRFSASHADVEMQTGITSWTFPVANFSSIAGLGWWGNSSGAQILVHAAKLELGSQQTLAHQENGNWVLNEIPDYGEQLRRCQRYYLSNKQRNAYGKSTSATAAYVDTPTPVTMRALPAIETGAIGHVICNGVKAAIASINPVKLNDESITLQLVLNTSVSVDYPAFLTDTKYALSADL